MSILLSGELEVDGNLTVTGTIQASTIDSLQQQISSLLVLIAQLEQRIAQLECPNSGNIPAGYCDCYGNTLDVCGVCGGDAVSENECYLTDIDGNTYETVEIGEQLWMAENLKTTHYNDGTSIPTGYSDSDWGNLSTDAYAVYPTDNDEASQSNCGDDCIDVYGNLYNWFAVDDERGVCPAGWHVPSDEEFMELEMYLGMSESEANDTGWRGTNEGSKLAGNAGLWNNGDLENDSEFGTSGFSAFPAGYRGTSSVYYDDMGGNGYFWSSSEGSSSNAWYRTLYYHNSSVHRPNDHKRLGFSIRCLGD